MNKQFVGGLILGAITGSYLMYNYLYKKISKVITDEYFQKQEVKKAKSEDK